MGKKTFWTCLVCYIISSCASAPGIEEQKSEIEYSAYLSSLLLCRSRGEVISSGCKVGNVRGTARIYCDFDEHVISVTYSAMGYTVTETGSLSGFRMNDSCGHTETKDSYHPISFTGTWQPTGSGGGNLLICFTKDNRVQLDITGFGHFHYWVEYRLKDDTYETILNDLQEAKEKIKLLNQGDTL